MKLSASIKATERYQGQTKFDFWRDIEVDDILTISMPLQPTGKSRGRIYAPTLEIINTSTGKIFVDTINSIQKYIQKLPHLEVQTLTIGPNQNIRIQI